MEDKSRGLNYIQDKSLNKGNLYVVKEVMIQSKVLRITKIEFKMVKERMWAISQVSKPHPKLTQRNYQNI